MLIYVVDKLSYFPIQQQLLSWIKSSSKWEFSQRRGKAAEWYLFRANFWVPVLHNTDDDDFGTHDIHDAAAENYPDLVQLIIIHVSSTEYPENLGRFPLVHL